MTQKTLTKPFNELTPQELERRKNFDCGEQSLNDYLTNRMRQHDEKNIAKSFLYVVDEEIVGYYTLSPTTIDFSEIYPDIAKKNKFPKHPIPAILLARLAIDKQHQGKGYSDLLMAEIVIIVLPYKPICMPITGYIQYYEASMFGFFKYIVGKSI